MSFSEALHRRNMAALDQLETDPLLRVFLKLHVASDYESDRSFRLTAVLFMRLEKVYKKFKLPQEQVETSLITGPLSVLALYALACGYGVNMDFEFGRLKFASGSGGGGWRVKEGLLVHRDGDDTSLFAVNPSKPCFSLAYYSAEEVASIGEKLNLPKGTKAATHQEIKKYLAVFF